MINTFSGCLTTVRQIRRETGLKSFYIHLSPERCGPFLQFHSHTAGCAQLPWTIALIFLILALERINYFRLFRKAASAITVSAPFTSLPSCLFPYSLGQPDFPLPPLHSCLPRSRGLPLFLVASTEEQKNSRMLFSTVWLSQIGSRRFFSDQSCFTTCVL